jgi:hypothetical protein
MIIEKLFKHPTIEEWAFASLAEEEYLDFMTAFDTNTKLWLNYEATGLIKEKIDLTETVYSNILQENIDIIVGEKIVLSEGATINDLHIFPRLGYWLNRYYESTGFNEEIEIIP